MLLKWYATASEPSLLEELWQYLSDKYFSVNFQDYQYENIQLTSNSFFSVSGIIIALFLGVMVAAVVTLFQKGTLGDLVRALDRESAYDPDRAKTLAELGLVKNAAIRGALRRGTSFGRFVHCVEAENYQAEQDKKRAAFEDEQGKLTKRSMRKKWREIPYRYDFSTDHFYIPEDRALAAMTQFNRKGANPLTLVLTVVGCVALMVLCCALLPEMVKLADNFVGAFKGN